MYIWVMIMKKLIESSVKVNKSSQHSSTVLIEFSQILAINEADIYKIKFVIALVSTVLLTKKLIQKRKLFKSAK